MTKNQLIKDIEEIEDAEQVLATGHADIWQNRMILMMLRVLHHILIVLVKKISLNI